LHDAFGEVLADHETGDVLPCLVGADAAGEEADRHHQLDLPVDDRARQFDFGVGTGEAAGKLGERCGTFRRRHSGLRRVVAIVQSDAEHLRRPRYGRPEISLDDRLGGRRADAARPGAKRRPLWEDRLRIGSEPAARCRLHVHASRLRDYGQPSAQIGELHERDLLECIRSIRNERTLIN